MAIESSDIDRLLNEYKAAVNVWIDTIRREVELSSANRSIAEIDQWERAADREEEARTKARALKKVYESALRREHFHF
jgi:hypothetical protein